MNKIKVVKSGGDFAKNSVDTWAIWDTGATGSAITKKLAKSLGLIPSGYTTVKGVNDVKNVPYYAIDIGLPNRVIVSGVAAAECEELSHENDKDKAGMLIGMDIIGLGDFAVSNFKGNTTFSFRMPSQKDADYVTKSPTQKRSDFLKKTGYGKKK